MELEIKHMERLRQINNYITYRPRVKTPIGVGTILLDQNCYRIEYDNGNYENLIKSLSFWKDNFKLCLNTISDLTQEIEVNGEKFYPLEKLTEIFGGRPISFDGNCFYTTINKSVVRKKEDVVPLHFSQLDAFNKLFEWHFDVFGLIEKNLAININNL